MHLARGSLPSYSWIWISSVQSLSRVLLFVIPWTAASQASLSITNSQSLLKLMSIASVMASNHLILCRTLLLLPSIFPSIKVFPKELVLHIMDLEEEKGQQPVDHEGRGGKRLSELDGHFSGLPGSYVAH